MNDLVELKNLFPALIIVALLSTIAYAISTQISIDNTGTIGEVLAYTDSASTIPLTSIDWGTVNPGTFKEEVIYINSTLTESATLALTDDMSTEEDAVLELSWSLTDFTIDAGELLTVTLTLTVEANPLDITTIDFQTFIDVT